MNAVCVHASNCDFVISLHSFDRLRDYLLLFSHLHLLMSCGLVARLRKVVTRLMAVKLFRSIATDSNTNAFQFDGAIVSGANEAKAEASRNAGATGDRFNKRFQSIGFDHSAMLLSSRFAASKRFNYRMTTVAHTRERAEQQQQQQMKSSPDAEVYRAHSIHVARYCC